MPSSVLLKSLPGGVMQDTAGNALSSRQIMVYQRGTSTPIQVWRDQAMSTPLVTLGRPVITGSDGTPGAIPGYIQAEESVDFVDVTPGGGSRDQAEAIDAMDVATGTATTLTAAGTIPAQSGVYLLDATAAAYSQPLPTAAGFNGVLFIKAITTSAHIVTLTGTGGQTIDGSSTVTLGTAASGASYQSVTLISDGANWRVV